MTAIPAMLTAMTDAAPASRPYQPLNFTISGEVVQDPDGQPWAHLVFLDQTQTATFKLRIDPRALDMVADGITRVLKDAAKQCAAASGQGLIVPNAASGLVIPQPVIRQNGKRPPS